MNVQTSMHSIAHVQSHNRALAARMYTQSKNVDKGSGYSKIGQVRATLQALCCVLEQIILSSA